MAKISSSVVVDSGGGEFAAKGRENRDIAKPGRLFKHPDGLIWATNG
jgi:hypothetical protein